MEKDLHEIRKFVETVWKDGASAGQCIRTSVFLQAVLGKGKVVGGWQGKGFLGKFHYWLEVDDTIIDLTADQFGHDKVIVTTKKDPRYKVTRSKWEWEQDTKYTKLISLPRWLELYKEYTK